MKKLLIGLGGLVALIVVAALVIPLFIPVDTYKAKVIALVKDQTGRDLRIAGPVSFSLLPSIALQANDVTFSNPAGAASPNMIQLKTLDVSLKLFPLLHGAIEVDHFKLVAPAIDLEVDKDGKPNWVFSGPAKPAAALPAPANPAPATTERSIPAISLGAVAISDGQASYLDQRSGEKRVLGDINMTLSLPSLSDPFNATGSATWNGEKVTLTLAIDDPAKLQQGGNSAVKISLAAAPINFSFQGNASGATLTKLSGATDLSVPSVRGLAKWAGVPFTAPGSSFGALAIKGKVDKNGSKIAFSDASISLDALKATGALTLDTAGARPALSGRLDLDKLDVNPYLPSEQGAASPPSTNAAPAPAPGAPPSKSASSGWSDAPIDLSPLKVADVDFSLSANSILYRKIAIGKSALTLQLKNGRLEANLTEMALYQGKGTGKVVADGSAVVPQIGSSFNLSGIAIQPLAHDAADFDRLTGAGAMSFDVAGHGHSQREIISSLDGKGSLNLANGKIEGVNLMAFMKNAVSSVAGEKSGGNETNFGALTGTYTITNGILHNNDLKLTSPEVPSTGAGTVDLPLRQVDYKLTPSVAGLVAVPVAITGPWDNLSYRPDLSGIAKSIAQDPGKLLDALTNKGSGGNSGSGASSLLKGLLGK